MAPRFDLLRVASQEVRAQGTKTGGGAVQRQLHPDNLATTEALTDATQAVETDYRTDAWGNAISGSTVDSPLVYHGGLGYWADADLGLYYVRARWLDPTTGGATIQRQPHPDDLATTEAVTDATQAVETGYRADAWGNVLSGSAGNGPPNVQDIRRCPPNPQLLTGAPEQRQSRP